MSIFGAMRTSVSGMNAQSIRLSALSDNIANADTTGYKAGSALFKTMLVTSGLTQQEAGSVDTRIRYGISQQGALVGTSSSTDIGIQGGGYFVVADANGRALLTREGSFRRDASGYLVNAGGFRLMGLAGSASDAVGTSGLTQLHIDTSALMAAPSTSGTFSANLYANAEPTPTGSLPSTNSADSDWTSKSSLVVYDNLGSKVTLDMYFTKTAANTWEVAVYDQATAVSGSGFPYSSGPIATQELQFDGATGALVNPASRTVDVSVPNGQTLNLALGGMSQLGAAYSVGSVSVNGNAPSAFSQIAIDDDGSVYAVYQNGARSKEGQIRLATTPSPDNMTPLSGNVYDVSSLSGDAVVGSPGTGAFGSLVASALESSTVDIASQLTDMIETQRAYSADSKAFQVATDMADILVNLKV